MRSGTFWMGVLGGIVASILIGLFVVPFLGVFKMTATGEPGLLDWWGNTNWRQSLQWRAPEAAIPDTAEPAKGLEHYKSSCLQCHGAPGASRAEWAHQMQPMPPKLWEERTQRMSDGEIFHVVHGGVRMTGMPAFGPKHSEDDVWNIVAFLRRLDRLTAEQKQQLKEAASRNQHQHGSGGGHGDGNHTHSASQSTSGKKAQEGSAP